MLLSGSLHIRETVGTDANTSASSTTGTLILSHSNNPGVSSIVFRSSADPGNDMAYVKYEDDFLNTGQGGLLTIGIENNIGTSTGDKISLFSGNGNGFVGVNTKTPMFSLDVYDNMRIHESVGREASSTNGSLILEHDNAGGVSSIVFKSKNNEVSDFGYIQYEENGGGGASERGVMVIGVENDAGSTNTDVISLFACGGLGFIGVNTKFPTFNLDVSGNTFIRNRLIVGNDVSMNGNLNVGGTIVNTSLTNALNLKANIANPTFTGTVSGITKSMVGLANVDNTSDANKPVSSATTTQLNLKANIANPTFTGVIVSAGDVSLNAGLRVVSDSSFNGNLFTSTTSH